MQQDMTTSGALAFISLLGISSALAQPTGEPASKNGVDGDKSGAWLFPVEYFNDTLPRWLRFGGEFCSRIESEDGIRYTTTNDTYLLSRVRVDVTIQPSKWLTFFGETQDSRVIFNNHVRAAVPFQNTWDIRQVYVQFGNSTADLTVGRQVLAFGNERVIGPSDWVNAGRTFDAVRFDVHQLGMK